jgi:glyoxylase-like metal-dependent hydrolase (beta-lactamase superfamily II)/rhodanese-related sulfurtransferase
MILEQYYLGCLAHASYLVADERSRDAAVVDPQRDVDQYIADAEARGLSIRYAILSHFHADFLAGHLELRDRCGAEIVHGARGEAEYAARRVATGDRIELGPAVRLEVLETPGHSPESISLVVFDADRGPDPYAVLTGDTLFIGDVGRPDLRAALGWTAEELGSLLFDSLRERLLPLPDETLVYPAHGAGSLCGKNLSTDTVSTIGVQRQFNYALQPMTKEDFIRIVTADQPDSPAYFTYDAILNTKERPTLEETLERELKPLDLADVIERRDRGAILLDTRDATEYAGVHIRGSINVGLDGSYATWCGTLLDPERPIVIVADPGREEESATRLGRIGFDNVAGYLRDGMKALDGRPELVDRTERITAHNLAEQLDAASPPLVLDVRTPQEVETGRIPGSLAIPLNHLEERLADIPRDREVVVACGSGYRSSTAVSLLEAHGLRGLSDLVGGMAAWEASHLETAA